MTVSELPRWLTKKELARELGVGVRWLEYRRAEGMPSCIIGGRRKFRVQEVEPWLERHGHLTREGRG